MATMEAKKMEASIVLAMVAMLLWARGAVAQSSHCSNVFISLSPCLNYITRNSSTPSPSCCSQLTTVVRSQPQCLCASSLGGINCNQTLALTLLGACRLQTSPITRCNVVSPYYSAETPKSPSEESRGELDLEVELAMGGGGGGGGDGGGGCLPSPMSNNRKLSSSFLFRSSSSKGFSETEAVMSPTSILEPFMGLRSSFWSESNSPRTPLTESKRPWDSKGIGLGIVDALTEENSDQKPTKSDTRMVLLGSQLKIQIPPLPQFVSPTDESPRSPAEFGIKTRNPHLGSLSPVSSLSPAKKSSSSGHETPTSPLVFTGCLSADEIEQSEDYTCVISHGPNPRTTHIFGDCVIESGAGVYSPARKENGFFRDRTSFSSENFLSFCYNCKKKLEEDKDIYIYRGDKAFCSHECRYQEMMLEEEGGD